MMMGGDVNKNICDLTRGALLRLPRNGHLSLPKNNNNQQNRIIIAAERVFLEVIWSAIEFAMGSIRLAYA